MSLLIFCIIAEAYRHSRDTERATSLWSYKFTVYTLQTMTPIGRYVLLGAQMPSCFATTFVVDTNYCVQDFWKSSGTFFSVQCTTILPHFGMDGQHHGHDVATTMCPRFAGALEPSHCFLTRRANRQEANIQLVRSIEGEVGKSPHQNIMQNKVPFIRIASHKQV